ncbi:hypothetical protein P3U62_08255 [Mammaliicoccus vitulinus]|uniref:hypothetical protein n=1 Tax=Mammaliicoccus vitulinus TaxID=71237 RepID=UPI002B26341C|nr:hypothetical protein [Mammaliicoccus vitulinus]WQK87043.1 hypothetical protein P3U62_08255 [Mammaliicoccus vitulinus]
MTLAMIALTFSLVALAINIVVLVKKNRDSEQKAYTIHVNRKVEYLTDMVQPLIDKYREEQEKELIETCKKHWKSFNTWKFYKDNSNENGDNIVCGDCLNDSLELRVKYKLGTGESCYATNVSVEYLRVKNDYPILAEQKCGVCGNITDKWECE